jgi:hypothetical protein
MNIKPMAYINDISGLLALTKNSARVSPDLKEQIRTHKEQHNTETGYGQ